MRSAVRACSMLLMTCALLADSASARELEPERVDIPIVVQPHARPAPSVHQEEKRTLLAKWPEKGHAQGDHEPHETR